MIEQNIIWLSIGYIMGISVIIIPVIISTILDIDNKLKDSKIRQLENKLAALGGGGEK